MEAKINFDNFYKQLTEDEKQVCDLCRDWNLGECEECRFISHHNSKKKIKQEVKQNERCVVHDRLP